MGHPNIYPQFELYLLLGSGLFIRSATKLWKPFYFSTATNLQRNVFGLLTSLPSCIATDKIDQQSQQDQMPR